MEIKVLESDSAKGLNKKIEEFIESVDGNVEIVDADFSSCCAPHKGYYINYSYSVLIKYNKYEKVG